MGEFGTALLTHGFLQAALLAGLLASVGCGIAGTYVVVKRIGFLAGGIAHAVLGGMGAALYFGVDPMRGRSSRRWPPHWSSAGSPCASASTRTP